MEKKIHPDGFTLKRNRSGRIVSFCKRESIVWSPERCRAREKHPAARSIDNRGTHKVCVPLLFFYYFGERTFGRWREAFFVHFLCVFCFLVCFCVGALFSVLGGETTVLKSSQKNRIIFSLNQSSSCPTQSCSSTWKSAGNRPDASK